MDYDDKEFQGQNLQLAGEGCSKVSPILRPYALPKFDFDDNTLQGHLRFDSLVENEVFLGITSQEDNQWIEEYSRGNSEIDFSSSAVESRRNNVWSEATSSESVEMLLKSVGQEEKVVEETIIKESGVCDEPGRLDNNIMDPNSSKDDANEHVMNETSQAHYSQMSGLELDKIGINETHNSSVLEEKVDAIPKRTENLVNESESMDKELQEDPSVDTSIQHNIKCQENSTDVPIEVKKSLNTILNVESVENPSVETNISPVASENVGNFETKLENPNSLESNASLTAGNDSNEDAIGGDNASEIRSTEPGVICLDQDVSLNETGDAGLPRGSADVDIIEVGGALDSQTNVESSSKIGYSFQSDMPVRAEPVAATEPDKSSSPDTSDGPQVLSESVATADDQPKSPIFGVSLVHQDSKEKGEVEGNSQTETPQVESGVDSVSKNGSLVEKEAPPDRSGKITHGFAVDFAVPVENHNAMLSEQVPETHTGGQECSKTSEMTEVNKSNELKTSNVSDVNHIGQDGGGVSSLEKPQSVSSRIVRTELSQSANDKQDVSKNATLDNVVPSKVTDDVDGNVQSVSLSSITQEEKTFTFEVGRSVGLGQACNVFHSYPTFQPNLPTITEGPSVNSSSSQEDAKKLHEASLVSPQNPSGMKGKTERKTRRKSVGKESARKVNQPKESTPARDSRKVEKSTLSLTPLATSQIIKFEEVKPNENVGVRPVPSPKLPDLNNSSNIFQQPFTDSQQVQLRAQILVYGSLISGTPPEEPHMIAAFGQSDGARRTWEGVWRSYLERLLVQKANLDTPMQSRSGNHTDQGTKPASIQNKIPTSPIISPMIPLWNISTPGDSLPSSSIPRPTRLDYHQPLSPLQPYQTLAMQNFTGHNPSWPSQAPFSGQWLASSPIPTFNSASRFSTLPITEAVKLTPVKESGLPVAHSTGATVFPVTGQLSGDSKSRKRKKGTTSVNIKPISDPSLTHKIPLLTQNQTDSVAVSTPAFVTSKSSPANFLSSVLTSGYVTSKISPAKVVVSEETLSKVEESKLQAVDAARLAAAAVGHCEGVWSRLGQQNGSGLNSDDEAKLVSSAVSVAAAASVAKVAAAAAKIASNVAEQERSMVEGFDQIGKAETIDAIVKAAELAAEAVAQAGKIVAMGDPLLLRDLVEAGPEGYWKTPRLVSKQQAIVSGNLNISSDKKNIEAVSNVSNKEIPEIKCGLPEKQNSGDLDGNKKMDVDGPSVSVMSREKDTRKPRVHKGPDLSKTVGVTSELDIGSVHMPKVTSDALKENSIEEGCLVEVYKDDDKYKGAWFGANVLSLKDEKALVCYTEIQSDEGQLKEWVPLKLEGTEVPKIRVAHPVTNMRHEGTRKRRRTAMTDFVWSSGDRVDVWIEDHWREGVVVEMNKIDVTSLTVRFPGHGETLVVRSWHVRPTMIWKDGKWIECHTSNERLSSQGDMPQEKRLKLGSPVVESKMNNGSSENVDHVNPKKQEESRTLPLSTQESLFSVGNTKDNNKIGARRTIRSNLQKDGPRVVFGVPKPGKKQKFMDVSKHYDKNDKPHDSVKFTRYLIPQPPGSRGWKNNSRTEAKEKQAIKSRKPPVPATKTSRDATVNKNQSGHHFGSASNIENATGHAAVSSLEVRTDLPKRGFTPSTKTERLNKRKFVPAGEKEVKTEKSVPENVEPRRSNRKIQPTSRLLEGLQSSMTISKIPAASHSSQRSHSKVTPKGNTNTG